MSVLEFCRQMVSGSTHEHDGGAAATGTDGGTRQEVVTRSQGELERHQVLNIFAHM